MDKDKKGKKITEKLSTKNEDQKKGSWKTFDLVCGMELSMENVRHAFEHNGKEYYFCSKTCKSHFVDDPDKYVVENY